MTHDVNLWQAATDAAPDWWRIAGLRRHRDERWMAEACGPEGACLQVEHEDPHGAIQALTERLRAL